MPKTRKQTRKQKPLPKEVAVREPELPSLLAEVLAAKIQKPKSPDPEKEFTLEKGLELAEKEVKEKMLASPPKPSEEEPREESTEHVRVARDVTPSLTTAVTASPAPQQQVTAPTERKSTARTETNYTTAASSSYAQSPAPTQSALTQTNYRTTESPPTRWRAVQAIETPLQSSPTLRQADPRPAPIDVGPRPSQNLDENSGSQDRYYYSHKEVGTQTRRRTRFV